MQRQFEGGDSKAQICVASGDYLSVASDRGNTVATIRIHNTNIKIILNYGVGMAVPKNTQTRFVYHNHYASLYACFSR